MKVSFGFLRGNGSYVLMFVKALLSVETIIACLKARQYFYSRVVLRRKRLLRTLRIPMPTSKTCLDNDERDFQVLVALFFRPHISFCLLRAGRSWSPWIWVISLLHTNFFQPFPPLRLLLCGSNSNMVLWDLANIQLQRQHKVKVKTPW